MARTIRFTAEIECPDEGYDDVCPDLIILDFIEDPKGFGFRSLGDVSEATAQETKK